MHDFVHDYRADPLAARSQVQQCNSYIMVYLKFSTGNYSIAEKRGHWPASEDISLPYLTWIGKPGQSNSIFNI